MTADQDPASLQAVEDHPEAFKIPISGNQYYLIENRQQTGFDSKLPIAGLAIWRINETVVNSGLNNNTVNADHTNKGVDLEEADGQNHLDSTGNRGDDGDVFPGSSNNQTFDNSTNPSSTGQIAVCDIGSPADPVAARILVSTGTCGNGVSNCTNLLPVSAFSDDGSPPIGWIILLLPTLLAAGLAYRGWHGRRTAVAES